MNVLLAFAASVLLQAGALASGDHLFQNGDTVCFLGDSITHGGAFHSYVYDYYLTRFPERTIRFVNAGVAGDSAGGALGRLSEDVSDKRPTVVVVMFGMNDVNRGSYVAAPSAQQRAAQEQALEGYRKNMAVLVERLSAPPAPRLLFATPSPFDQTVRIDRDNNQPGCNEGLGRCAEFVTDFARARGARVVDFHGPMTAYNLERQKADPGFTIVGPDRVHPGPPGHLMMAWLFLRAQGATSLVSRVAIDAAHAHVSGADNADVSGLAVSEAGVAFSVLERALPFPVADSARSVLATLPIMQDLDQEVLVVQGLAPGSFDVRIDGASVGSFEGAALGRGINLAELPSTPQLAQARQVAKANEARRAAEVVLRNYAAVRWFLRHRAVDPDDLGAVKLFAETRMSKTGYYEGQVPAYLANWSKRGEVEGRIRAIEQDVAALRKPVAHRYEIVRTR